MSQDQEPGARSQELGAMSPAGARSHEPGDDDYLFFLHIQCTMRMFAFVHQYTLAGLYSLGLFAFAKRIDIPIHGEKKIVHRYTLARLYSL